MSDKARDEFCDKVFKLIDEDTQLHGLSKNDVVTALCACMVGCAIQYKTSHRERVVLMTSIVKNLGLDIPHLVN